MNQVVIVFVPVNVTQHDFESALGEHCGTPKHDEATPHTKTTRTEIADNDQLPLWTWLLPNPCCEPSQF
jgi:hypothetical protein